jgi:hypothetical protein
MGKSGFRASLAAFAVLLMAGSTATVEAQGQQAIVIQGGTLIDGLGGAPIANSVVVIESDRISAVGAAGQVDVPNGAQVIDASGKWVLPGLVDAKANWNWMYGEAFLHYGVTSAMVSGGRNNSGLADRDAINHGIYRGPRLFQTAVTINGPGPNLDRGQNYAPGEGSRRIYTGEEGVEHVRTLHDAGVDFITFQNGDGPPELFAPAVEEAQDLGMGVVFRAMGPQTRAREVCEMGDGIVLVHTGNVGSQIAADEEKWATYIGLPPQAYVDMDEAKVDPMIQHLRGCNAYLEPDLIATARGFPSSWQRIREEAHSVFEDTNLTSYYPAYAIGDLYDNIEMPETWMEPDALATRRTGFQNHTRFLKRYVDAGGKLVAASDITQSAPGLGLHAEFTVFVEDVGLTPMQAIQAATKWVSEGFREPDVGSIEVGKFGDVLILDADPLQNIWNTRQIHMVIKGGEIVDRNYNPAHRAWLFANTRDADAGPVVTGDDWAEAVKDATFRPNVNSVRGEPGLPGIVPNFHTSPTPGIEGMTPHTVTRGAGDTTINITGFNFVQRSLVYVDGAAVPTTVNSRTEITATVPANVLASAGKLEVVVKNPEPISQPVWGDTSNAAYLLVPFEFTKTLPQPGW